MFFFNDKLIYSLIILAFVASIIAYTFCPAEIPIHFNGWNNPDAFANKAIGLFIMPALMLVLLFTKRSVVSVTFGIYLLFVVHLFLLYVAVNY